jgi:hypothetical protein
MSERADSEEWKPSSEPSEFSQNNGEQKDEGSGPEPKKGSEPDCYEDAQEAEPQPGLSRLPLRTGTRRRLAKPELRRPPLTAKERLLLFDTWRRSKLPAADFAVLVGLTSHTLHEWKRRFEEEGPEPKNKQKLEINRRHDEEVD